MISRNRFRSRIDKGGVESGATGARRPPRDPSPESGSSGGEHRIEEKHLLEMALGDRQFAVKLIAALIDDGKQELGDASQALIQVDAVTLGCKAQQIRGYSGSVDS